MAIARRPIRLLIAIGAGAAIAYYLDPSMGRSRRAQTRDRALAFLGRGGRTIDRLRMRTAARGYGVLQRAKHPGGGQSDLDDVTLARKVETELFSSADVPKGNINVNAEEGTVVLRGEIDSEDLIQEIESRTRKITGVLDVRNLLHLPGQVPPNKAEAHQASAEAAGGDSTRSYG